MKRFFGVVAIVALAGATYVATAAGGQHAAVSAKQLLLLKRQVATLSKKVKTQGKTIKTLQGQVGTEGTTLTTVQSQLSSVQSQLSSVQTTSSNDDAFISSCLKAEGAFGVSQYGDSQSSGFVYSSDAGNTFFLTTALDFDSVTPHAYFQAVAPSCVSAGGAAQNGVRSEPRQSVSAGRH